MIRNNCLNSLSRTIEHSSERTKAVKQKTIYKTLENNMVNYNSPNPVKNNGSRYNDTFGVKICHDNSGVVISAQNYESLLDLTKGKYFANPNLTGMAGNIGSMWSGNFLVMDYDKKGISYPIWTWNGWILPDISGAITYASDTTIPVIGDYNGPGNEGPDDQMWLWSPGYTIDPSNILFYHKCSALSHTPVWYNYFDMSYQNTQMYWTGVAANPLENFAYPAPIMLNYQNTINTDYTPIMPADASYTWCNGFPNKID